MPEDYHNGWVNPSIQSRSGIGKLVPWIPTDENKKPTILMGKGNFEDCIVPLTLTEDQFREEINKQYEDKPFEETITELCNNMAKFLIAKNTKYGNSALEPLQIFSHSSSGDQLNNRIDDKLSRIKNSEEPRKNDIVDLIGYLHLKLIDEGWTDFKELID